MINNTIWERLCEVVDLQDSITHLNEMCESGKALRDLQVECKRAMDTIIADWNAAVEAMKDSITYDIEDHEDGRWYCHFCSGNYTVDHTDDCRVLSLQAALARMEETDGND